MVAGRWRHPHDSGRGRHGLHGRCIFDTHHAPGAVRSQAHPLSRGGGGKTVPGHLHPGAVSIELDLAAVVADDNFIRKSADRQHGAQHRKRGAQQTLEQDPSRYQRCSTTGMCA